MSHLAHAGPRPHAKPEMMRAQRIIRATSVLAVIAALLIPGPVGALDGAELVSTVAGGANLGPGSDQLNDGRGIVVSTDGVIYVPTQAITGYRGSPQTGSSRLSLEATGLVQQTTNSTPPLVWP